MTAAVHVLCGPAWSGKTERMLAHYRARLADAPGGVLWLGPTVRAVEAVRTRLLQETAGLCCPRLHTFQEVVQEIVRVNDPAARPLSAVQRRLLAEDLVADLSDGGRLPYFAGVADTRGFTDGVLGLLTDLQRNAIPPTAFAEKSAGVGAKERQCAQLYAHYHGELQRQNLHDADGAAGLACGLLRQGRRRPFAEVRAVFVDGFSDFTNPQHEFLELLCGWVEELWVALPGERDDLRGDLFARSRGTLERLAPLRPEIEFLPYQALSKSGNPTPSPLVGEGGGGGLAPSPPTPTLPHKGGGSQTGGGGQTGGGNKTPRPAGLVHLERQLFRPLRAVEPSADASGIALIEAPGVLGEARLVARRIKTLLLDGAAPDNVLVVLRDVSPYADILGEVFDEYGLPVELEGAEPLTRNPAAALLLRASRLMDDDWPFAGVTALLRNTYFRPLWPEAAGSPDLPQKAEALLRLLGEPRGRAAYLSSVQRWAEQQQPGLEDEEAEESRRRRTHELAQVCAAFLHRFFKAWDDAPARGPLAEHVAWLRLFAQDVGVTRAAEETESDKAALERLWSELAQWLGREERRHGPGGRSLDRKTFLRRLNALAAESSLPRSPSAAGRVRVLSANQARHLEADHVLVMGLGERSFPRLTPPAALFDEQERQMLQGAGLDFGPGDLLPEEMLLFYQVAARARVRLVLSFPAVDERGQALLPSSFLSAVRHCFTKDAFKDKTEQQNMLIEGVYEMEPLSAAEYRVRAAAAWKSDGLHDPALPANLRANLLDAAKLYERRFHTKEHNPYDGRFRDPAVIGELTQMFGPQRVFSPTALEEYVACPFRFYLRHVLRLEPLEEPSEEIEVTRRGQAFHRALARLHRKLKVDGVNTPTDAVTLEMTRQMADAVDEDVRRAPSLAAKELWRLEGQRLLKQAEKYVDQWRKFVEPWEERKVAPRPSLFEADFGVPAPSPPTPLPQGERGEGEKAPFGPLVVRIDDVEVRVSGRIDRVDLAELDDGVGFWIIDYKTGRSEHYTDKPLKDYRRLQLTLYALAVEEVLLAGQAARPLGMAYWLVGEAGPKVVLPGRSAAKWLDDYRPWSEIREQLRRWVVTLVRRIRQGIFVLQPREKDCTQTCDFGQICRITQARAVGKEGLLPLPLAAVEESE